MTDLVRDELFASLEKLLSTHDWQYRQHRVNSPEWQQGFNESVRLSLLIKRLRDLGFGARVDKLIEEKRAIGVDNSTDA